MVKDAFAQWLEGELARRGWKASDLAREAGINQGTLSNVLNGVRGAGLDFCVRIASALRVPPELVLRQAGLLPALPDETPLADELGYLFRQLSARDQERAVAITRTLLHTAEGQTQGPAEREPLHQAGAAEPDTDWNTVEEWKTDTSPPAYRTSVGPSTGGPGLSLRWRRALIYAVSGFLVVAIVTIVAVGFAQGSWWYSYSDDRALDRSARASVEAVRDKVKESGVVPEAVVWLDAALAPGAHPSDVRLYLMTARDLIRAVDTAEAPALADQVDGVINSIRAGPAATTGSATPIPISTMQAGE